MLKIQKLLATGTAVFALSAGFVGLAPVASAANVDEIVDVQLPQGCTLTAVRAEARIVTANGPEVTVNYPYVILKAPDAFGIVNGTTGALVAYVSCI